MSDTPYPDSVLSVLASLRIYDPQLLGKGGEGYIFAYKDKALKIYIRSEMGYVRQVADLQTTLAGCGFPFSIPRITDIGQTGGSVYSVEDRLTGTPMDILMRSLPADKRQILIRNYYNAVRRIGAVTFSGKPFGQILSGSESVTGPDWVHYLLRKLEQKNEKNWERLRCIGNLEMKTSALKQALGESCRWDGKNLVHCDYYLNNVLANDDLSVSAVLDFSIHSAVGDPRYDIASVLLWNTIDRSIQIKDYDFLFDLAEQDFGPDIRTVTRLYFLFSCYYYADMEDPSYCLDNLNDPAVWKGILDI